MLKHFLSIIFFILLVPAPSFGAQNEPAAGITHFGLDFDGTITSESDRSPWTPFYNLVRIDELHSMIQYTDIHETLPSLFPVTIQEFYKIEHLLGSERKIKSSAPFQLKKNAAFPDRPLTIYPNYYMLNEGISYSRFRTHPKKNYLVEDLRHALSKQTNQNGSFYGLTYEMVSWFMENPTKADLSLHTARGQTHKDFSEFFNELLKSKHLKQMSNQFRVHSLNSPSSRINGRTLLEKKLASYEVEIGQLAVRPLQEKGKGFLHVDEAKVLKRERERKHLFIAAEDNPQYAHAIFKKIRRSSQENLYRNKIKFVFIHAGDKKYVEDDQDFKGRRALVFNNGKFRTITDVELKEELHMSLQSIKKFGIKYTKLSARPNLHQISAKKPTTNINKKKQSKKKSCKKTWGAKAS